MILVTGGARSGKSSFGESILKDEDRVLYIATSIPKDEEMVERVKNHRESRNQNWDTLESYKNLGEQLKEGYTGIIVDCITIMVTNLLFHGMESFEEEDFKNMNFRKKEEEIIKEISLMVKSFKEYALKNSTKIVLITNEVGSGLVPEYKLGRQFRDIAGRVNQYLAKEAKEVYFVVSGIPMKIKGE